MDINFFKYQGTGNDFIMIDGREFSLGSDPIPYIQQLCDRKFGVGADGLIILKNHATYDFEMCYYNADGSQSMCGNGARCAVAFASFLGIIKEETTFLAIDGEHTAKISGNSVALKMGDVKEIQYIDSDYFINTGAPHHLRFVDKLEDYDVVGTGQKIRNDRERYPEGTNVNFFSSISPDKIKVRTYERGVENETLSCGTGVTACALIYGLQQNKNKIDIQTPGGNLQVSFERTEKDGFREIILTGPADQVFSGNISLKETSVAYN
jgi:diaminopimelate epimerase